MRNKAQEWVPFNGWHQDREYGFQIAKYGLGEESAKLSKKNNMIHIFFSFRENAPDTRRNRDKIFQNLAFLLANKVPTMVEQKQKYEREGEKLLSFMEWQEGWTIEFWEYGDPSTFLTRIFHLCLVNMWVNTRL